MEGPQIHRFKNGEATDSQIYKWKGHRFAEVNKKCHRFVGVNKKCHRFVGVNKKCHRYTDLYMKYDITKYPFQKESHAIIGICMEVHRILGKGLLEIVYKDAIEYDKSVNLWLSFTIFTWLVLV